MEIPSREESPVIGGTTGIGGGLPFLEEVPTTEMVAQELPYSCQVACARQLLRDAGVDVDESALCNRIGYLDGFGTIAPRTAEALSELHPALDYKGGSIDPAALAVLFRLCPWIATLRTSRGTYHSVIVDKLEGEVVWLRDPWGATGPNAPTGSRAKMRLRDFIEHWNWGFNDGVIPRRRKEGR